MLSSPSRRVAVLHSHLTNQPQDDDHIDRQPTYSYASEDLPTALNKFLVRDNLELRAQIFEFLKDPLFRPNYYLSLQGTRELTSQRMAKFVQQRFFNTMDYINNPLKFQAALESLSFCDYSLAIKDGVHFTLCGGTIAKLGTERHHREILPKMDTLELPGCFAMTELGHGSNVMGIETTAVFDGTHFIINTPNPAAAKAWIGGAAHTAKICSVFAQLTINGKWEGPHVFAVRLRDDNGRVLPGVRCADHGPKQGLNGVDNGQIWFDNYKVPREALLDKIASVDAQGRYHSAIQNPAQRFGFMISGLTTGRLLIAQAAVDACKMGVTIAIRYGLSRPQFGNKPIADYATHQKRLYPALATTYAMHLSMLNLKNLALASAKSGSPALAKQVHILSSGVKAAATWNRVKILQDCRECCGGMGFLAANKIGPMLNDMNVDVTFEGDNTVMMQQVAKERVSENNAKTPPSIPTVNADDLGLGCCSALLRWRAKALTAELVSEMAAFTAAGGKSAEAFDANSDLAVKLGWADVDASAFDTFVDELNKAPTNLTDVLGVLCLSYGLSRVEAGLETYLAAGVLPGSAVGALRRKILGLCGKMNAHGGKMVLDLTDGFGIPDHLLQAPIAVKGSRWEDSPFEGRGY